MKKRNLTRSTYDPSAPVKLRCCLCGIEFEEDTTHDCPVQIERDKKQSKKVKR